MEKLLKLSIEATCEYILYANPVAAFIFVEPLIHGFFILQHLAHLGRTHGQLDLLLHCLLYVLELFVYPPKLGLDLSE